MARIVPVAGRRASPLLRLVNWGAKSALGREYAPLGIVGHSPGMLLPYLAVSRFVRGRTQLPPGIRALATQLVAELNGCSWCVDFGRYEGARLGLPADKLLEVREYARSPLYSRPERAALAYAEAATQVGARVPDAIFAALREHFSERAIVELALAVAAENFYNRLNAPLEVESQGFCSLPAAGLGAGARLQRSSDV